MSSKRKLDGNLLEYYGRKKQATERSVSASSAANSVCEPPHDPHGLSITAALDFSSLCTRVDISTRFDVLAQAMLCTHVLSVVHGTVRTDYDILELEFYLQKAHVHEDPFTHGAVEQERSGQWYFHRMPRHADENKLGLPVTAAGEYRSGTRKGLDLTVGVPPPPSPTSALAPVTMRGGALLRTLRRHSDRQIICGPSLLVDEVLRASGAPSVSALVAGAWGGDIAALAPPARERDTYMYLCPRASLQTPAVHRSPRIGLDLSHPTATTAQTNPRVTFVGAPYRYSTHPELLGAKGRAQTFVGLYRALRESEGYAHGSLKLKQALCRLMAVKEQQVQRFLADYGEGYEAGALGSFVGAAGKGVCQSPSAYLKMMGALQRAMETNKALRPD